MIAYRTTQRVDENGEYLLVYLDGLTDRELAIYKSLPKQIDFVPNTMFDSPSAQEDLFGPQAQLINVFGWTDFPGVDHEPSITAPRRKSLSQADEKTLFLRYNYARMKLSALMKQMKERKTFRRVQSIVMWQSRALAARRDLVNANMALVVAMAKRTRINGVEFLELVSEGNMALLRSIEKFDVSRGFKFSTYACRAILKSFNRLASKTGRYRSRFPTEFDPDLERSDYDVMKHQYERDDSVESLRDILARNRANLNDIERTVVMERFAIGTDSAKGQTLSQVGKIVGLTNERVRQIQNHALGKIRSAMARSK